MKTAIRREFRPVSDKRGNRKNIRFAFGKRKMKEKIKVKIKKWDAVLFLMAVAGAITIGWLARQYQLPKFHDLTVELGTEIVTLEDFATEFANPGRLRFVSDPEMVDLNRVGTTEITLAHGNKEETVSLTVQDTTAPEATFLEKLSVRINHIPAPGDCVSDIRDESETKVYFASEVVLPKDYSDTAVTVVVEDIHGNRTEGQCILTYSWMKESYELEYGQPLKLEDILMDPVRDASLIDPAELEQVNTGNVGVYTVTGRIGEQTAACHVTVVDTKGPELKLKEVQIYPGGIVDPDAFIESVADISGVARVQMLSTPDNQTKGRHPIVFEAKDIHGNTTFAVTNLWVATDKVAPRIFGVGGEIRLEKHTDLSTLDFLEGISAWDTTDGACEVTCNMDGLNVRAGGTYYITYVACDQSGNRATVKRKVTVEHDAEDTAALVASIAAQLGDDPEELRNYVRRTIGYNHDWGGDDPVWHGFTTHRGNCYVHAMCLKSIFDLKGIENQLIWVTNKSHYWLLVKIDGNWKHIDPTPSRLHGRYSLMNDEQRRSTLSGRVWDTTAWPACE